MSEPNVMIACAGPQRKWGNHLGVPSHLVKDKNQERILDRTIRLVQERGTGHEELTVLSPPDPRYDHPYVRNVFVPEIKATEFHTTRDHWSTENKNILLLGDTWFSEDAIDKILGFPGHALTFFGRSGPSKLTGSPWGELFAYSWTSTSNWIIDDSLSRIHKLYERKKLRRFTGWELLMWLQGATEDRITREGIFPHVTTPEFFVEINDLCDDLDFPIDYERHPMFGGSR